MLTKEQEKELNDLRAKFEQENAKKDETNKPTKSKLSEDFSEMASRVTDFLTSIGLLSKEEAEKIKNSKLGDMTDEEFKAFFLKEFGVNPKPIKVENIGGTDISVNVYKGECGIFREVNSEHGTSDISSFLALLSSEDFNTAPIIGAIVKLMKKDVLKLYRKETDEEKKSLLVDIFCGLIDILNCFNSSEDANL